MVMEIHDSAWRTNRVEPGFAHVVIDGMKNSARPAMPTFEEIASEDSANGSVETRRVKEEMSFFVHRPPHRIRRAVGTLTSCQHALLHHSEKGGRSQFRRPEPALT